jgi:hypothetical protein
MACRISFQTNFTSLVTIFMHILGILMHIDTAIVVAYAITAKNFEKYICVVVRRVAYVFRLIRPVWSRILCLFGCIMHTDMASGKMRHFGYDIFAK